MLPSGRGGMDNFQARGVTKGQFATAEFFIFHFYHLQQSRPAMDGTVENRWGRRVDGGRYIGAGGVKSVYMCWCVCDCSLLPIQMPKLEICIWSNMCFCKTIFFTSGWCRTTMSFSSYPWQKKEKGIEKIPNQPLPAATALFSMLTSIQSSQTPAARRPPAKSGFRCEKQTGWAERTKRYRFFFVTVMCVTFDMRKPRQR